MPGRTTLYRAVFAATLAALGGALAAGVVHSVRNDGRLPSLELDTTRQLNELLAAGDYEASARHARAISAIASFDSGSVPLLRSVVAIARAHGDRPGEIFALRRLILLRPRAPALRNRLATLLLEANRWEAEEAVEHSRIALRLDPRSTEARTNLGVAALARGDHDEAERHFREALDLDPGAERAKRGLEEALARQEAS